MSYNPDIKYQTDGVVSILEAPDPTFDPTYSYIVGDEASADSWYGFALVKFFSWTPTESGTVYVAPPADDAEAGKIDLFVFDGDAAPLSGPASPTLLADGFFARSGLVYNADSFAATAGTTYTLAATRYTAGFDNNFTAALVPTFSLRDWFLTTQVFGGQATIIPWRPVASGLFACAEGYGTLASGDFSHTEGELSVASALSSHAEGTSNASGVTAHAEGNGTIASGPAAHTEGTTTVASGISSHAEGLSTTASGYVSHAEGNASIASGPSAHAEGTGTAASADSAHAEGFHTIASAVLAHAEGAYSLAKHFAEHAATSGQFVATGDAQYSRFVLLGQTTNATPASIAFGDTSTLAVASGESYAVDIQLIASREDVAGTLASWHIRGLFTAAGGALRRIGSLDVLHHNDADASTWAADVVATSANIDIQVTGENAKTIRWVATVHATKVSV